MDSASSAQSKRVGRGETARLWSSLGERGQTGSEGGTGGGQGVFIGINGIVSGTAGVVNLRISVAPGASRMVGTGFGGVLLGQVACPVVPELCRVVGVGQSRGEHGRC